MSTSLDSLFLRMTPHLSQLEDERAKLKKRGTQQALIALLAALGVGIVLSFAVQHVAALPVCLVVGGIVGLILIQSKSTPLSLFYKQHIVAPMLESLVPGATYQPESGIPESLFRSCQLFDTDPDRYHSEDLMQGKIDKTAFSLAEVHAEKRVVTVDAKGRTSEHWQDIFKGFLFVADFNKNFSGQTLLHRDTWIKLPRKGSRIKLEDPRFEKYYDVYGTDPVESRYILTPSLMERIVEMNTKFDKPTLSFINSNVVVAIATLNDYFETSIWKPANRKEKFLSDFGMLIAMLDVVRDLNLNNRIWSKE